MVDMVNSTKLGQPYTLFHDSAKPQPPELNQSVLCAMGETELVIRWDFECAGPKAKALPYFKPFTPMSQFNPVHSQCPLSQLSARECSNPGGAMREQVGNLSNERRPAEL